MKNPLIKQIPNLNIDITNKSLQEISEEILQSKEPEKNYYAALYLGLNKINHLLVVIASKDPLWNFKCIKHCIKTTSLTLEEKKILVKTHSQVIMHSNNRELINELNKFLKYNKVEEKYSPIKRKKRK